jgi:putative hydrolase
LFLSPEQRDIVGRMQALMTVVEGHGNFVMNRVGSERISSYETMKRSLGAQREQAGAIERAVQRAIGIDLKFQQYTLGENFFQDVEGRAGMGGVNAVWESPENLPDLDEIRDAAAWLRRVAP